MAQRIFWTCVLTKHLIGKHGLSFAASYFSFNLMSGGGFDKVYSTMPLFVGGEIEKEAFEDKRYELVYDKLRHKRGIWQKIAALKEQYIIFRRIPKGASLWFYNLNTLNALLFSLLRVFKPSVQLNVIVLDFTPVESGFGLNRIYLKLINSSHGRICLANSALFNQKNTITLPGVVPADNALLPKVEIPTMKFLLSGALNSTIAQTDMVLSAFSELPQCELHITGSGADLKIVNEYASKYRNIVAHGNLPFGEYVELLHSITFQLSTRNPEIPENQCNFPSKIIEALLHNRAILTTIHYPQIKGIKVVECLDCGKDALKTCIENITYMSKSELLTYLNQGDKVKQMFSTEVWYQTMNRIELS